MKTPSPQLSVTPWARRDWLKAVALGSSALLVNPRRVFAVPPVEPPGLPPIVAGVPLTPLDAPAGTWTLAILPDTQHYTEDHPEIFTRQTEWLVKNRAAHRIQFVLHEGDIVNRDRPEQWERARKSMDVLNHGQVPYALILGNHDYNMKKPGRSTLINDYFSAADFRQNEACGFFEEKRVDNSWHVFTAPSGKFLVLALEFGPRDEVLTWANEIAEKFPDHFIILLTHAHVYSDDTRYDWAKYGAAQKWNPKSYPYAQSTTSVNDGEEVWHKLIAKHPKMRFVFNGHVCNDGTGYVASPLPNGKVVHQILANYQREVVPSRGYGGGGYMRLLQFLPDQKTVRVRSYSPLYDLWLSEPDQRFDLTWDATA